MLNPDEPLRGGSQIRDIVESKRRVS
jgi:hypothetical protein